MYLIKISKNFKKSYKRLKSSGAKESIFKDFRTAVKILVSGNKLPSIYRDHSLKGEYIGYNEFHIKGNLLVIYKIQKDILTLVLVDIGSHSELF